MSAASTIGGSTRRTRARDLGRARAAGAPRVRLGAGCSGASVGGCERARARAMGASRACIALVAITPRTLVAGLARSRRASHPRAPPSLHRNSTASRRRARIRSCACPPSPSPSPRPGTHASPPSCSRRTSRAPPARPPARPRRAPGSSPRAPSRRRTRRAPLATPRSAPSRAVARDRPRREASRRASDEEGRARPGGATMGTARRASSPRRRFRR